MHILKSLLILSVLALPQTAMASPKLQGSYGDWSVYTRQDGGDRICYVLSKAKTKSPSSVRHGDIYFLVANWRSGAASEQPSFMADFSLRSENPPEIQVGNSKFSMYTSQNEAFIDDNGDEQSLLKKMRAGSTMKINAVSGRGTKVNYSFSLKGITAALKKAKQSCS